MPTLSDHTEAKADDLAEIPGLGRNSVLGQAEEKLTMVSLGQDRGVVTGVLMNCLHPGSEQLGGEFDLVRRKKTC